jgi:hypothetical protein
MSNHSGESGKKTTQLEDWAAQLLDRITAAARTAIEERGPGPTDPVPARSPDLTRFRSIAPRKQEIYEALAEGIAHLRQPDFGPYDPDEVRTALSMVFPSKSGPPAPEWVTWLRRRVAELSSGMTALVDDEHPVPSETLLFRVYQGRVQGLFTSRQFRLTPAGVEYTS